MAGSAQCRRVKGDEFWNLRADEVRLKLSITSSSIKQSTNFAEREVAPTVRRSGRSIST